MYHTGQYLFLIPISTGPATPGGEWRYRNKQPENWEVVSSVTQSSGGSRTKRLLSRPGKLYLFSGCQTMPAAGIGEGLTSSPDVSKES